MITLTTTDRITLRSRSISTTGSNTVVTDILFANGDLVPILQRSGPLTFYANSIMTGKRITPPILYQLIANTSNNLLIKYKEKYYIIGKNMIFSYNIDTMKATPLMLHMVKSTAKTIREGKIVMNPDMFLIDSSFHKLFEIILKTGVDIELTRFIEDKYYMSLKLPKFGKPSDRTAYINDYKSWALSTLMEKSEI